MNYLLLKTSKIQIQFCVFFKASEVVNLLLCWLSLPQDTITHVLVMSHMRMEWEMYSIYFFKEPRYQLSLFSQTHSLV